MPTKTIQKFTTKHFADSVECCPIQGSEELLLVGNYQLLEGTIDETEKQDSNTKPSNCRVGRLYLFHLGSDSTSEEEPLVVCEEIEHSGILDIKWYRSTINGCPLFGCVDADGQLCLFQVEGEESKSIKKIFCKDLGPDILGLSLDWSLPKSSGTSDSSSPVLIASSSDGKLSTWQITESNLEKLVEWDGHSFEAWICAFNYSDPNLVYSGGDDCRFKGWDLRSPPTRPIFINKTHSMGVCSIQSNTNFDHLLATGSYDEQLLIWDSRKMTSPLKDLGLGGGIWRIKWEPLEGRYILTASMHNGFHIVDTETQAAGDTDLQIVAHYTEHESLAYGADWYYSNQIPAVLNQDEDERYNTRAIVSCSFYDSSLQLWIWQQETSTNS